MRTYTLKSQSTFRRPLPPQRPAGPLTKTQKAELSIGFRNAWALEGGYGDADEFRRAAVLAATGKAGLTACTQDDYRKCKAKIAELMGEDGEAINHHLADQTTPERVEMHLLKEALAKSGKPMAYAAAIARRRWKVTVEELSASQLKQLKFTILKR